MSSGQLPTLRKATATLRQATQPTVGKDAPRATDRPPHARESSRLVLERYRLHHRLGVGAFGSVWAARDEHLDRDVAVKIVPRERIITGRFEREARAAARLSHPGIVTLFEATTDEHDAYLVSELVIGSTLEYVLRAGRLSDRDIAAIAISLCDALAHAHAHGIVHRDVKPSNILVPDRPSSSAHPAKLTDFGVAHVIGGDSLTRTGEVIGTAAYMAPEQAEGREVTAAADLYALALVTYEALTGVNPVRTGTAAMRARRLGAHMPPLRRQRRDFPHELGRGIDQALRPRPRERGQLEELRRTLAEALPGLEDVPGVVGGAWRPRHPAEEPSRDQPEWLGERWPGPADDGQGGAAAPADIDEPNARPSWQARALAGASAALICAWLVTHILTAPAAAPIAAIAAALLTFALPRVGWAVAASSIAGAALAQHHPGAALILVLAAAIPAALLPRRGAAWPLAAGAPALGVLGLAGAWPAVAARPAGAAPASGAAGAWRRAALGLTGFVWLALVSPLAGTTLYVKLPPPPHDWAASLGGTVHHVLSPIVTSGALLAAPVWAVAAVALPLLTRSRSLAVNTVMAVTWGAVTVAFTQAALTFAHPHHGAATIRTATAGALASVAAAVLPDLAKAARAGAHPAGSRPELP